ncbi:MAG: WS/DGAT/MGAT family O-acyltransferase [Motilibacteraceae bacterium]
MSPLDEGFLHLEDRRTSLHIASLSLFEGPPPDHDQLTALFTRKLPLVPRYRQRVVPVPLDLGRPVWVDDPHFDLDYHLRRTALAHPGGDVELRRLVGRLMSQQLDRGKPLWEAWVVEGLAGDRWALVSKVHHSMVDGIAGTDLLSRVLDTSVDSSARSVGAPLEPAAWHPGAPLEPAAWHPGEPPGGVELVADALRERGLGMLAAAPLRAALTSPRRAGSLALTTARGLAGYAANLRPVPASSLVGPLGPHRRFRWGAVGLEDVRAVRAAHGGTINDVVLALVTSGFRALLLSRHEPPRRGAVRSLVPVSVRHADQRGRLDNRVSAILADLPVEVADPVERYAEVVARMRRLKGAAEAEAGEALTAAAGWVAAPVLASALHLAFRVPHRNLTTVTTNVPGPRQVLWACGRRMLATYPYVPIADRLRTGVAVTSYDDALAFGVTADRDRVPDVDVLLQGLLAAVDELRPAPVP